MSWSRGDGWWLRFAAAMCQTTIECDAHLPPLSVCREMERREAQSSEELRQLRQRAAQHGGSLG